VKPKNNLQQLEMTSEKIEVLIKKIEQFKIRTYPLGKDYDYSKTPRILGLPTWNEYEELETDLKILFGIKEMSRKSKKLKNEKIIKRKKLIKPHSGGFNKPCILNKEMTDIITKNLLKGEPEYQFDKENRLIYTPGLLTNWWSKYIHKEKLRNEFNGSILKYDKLLKLVSENYLSEFDIDLNADPHFSRVKKLPKESNEDFQKKKDQNKDRRFTYGNLQKILAKYIDLRFKDKSYEDYEVYFDTEKQRLQTYYSVTKYNLNKKEQTSKTSLISQKTEITDSNLKQEILNILNDDLKEEPDDDNQVHPQIDINDIEDF
jgi:hypothetical protein